jgi:hypothetical protein
MAGWGVDFPYNRLPSAALNMLREALIERVLGANLSLEDYVIPDVVERNSLPNIDWFKDFDTSLLGSHVLSEIINRNIYGLGIARKYDSAASFSFILPGSPGLWFPNRESNPAPFRRGSVVYWNGRGYIAGSNVISYNTSLNKYIHYTAKNYLSSGWTLSEPVTNTSAWDNNGEYVFNNFVSIPLSKPALTRWIDQRSTMLNNCIITIETPSYNILKQWVKKGNGATFSEAQEDFENNNWTEQVYDILRPRAENTYLRTTSSPLHRLYRSYLEVDIDILPHPSLACNLSCKSFVTQPGTIGANALNYSRDKTDGVTALGGDRLSLQEGLDARQDNFLTGNSFQTNFLKPYQENQINIVLESTATNGWRGWISNDSNIYVYKNFARDNGFVYY